MTSSFYKISNDTEVKHILREHPFLAQLLLNTYGQIERYFPDAQAFLEVVIDYEAFETYPQEMDTSKELVISITTSLLPEQAMTMFREFHDKFWLISTKDAKGKISIGLEFL